MTAAHKQQSIVLYVFTVYIQRRAKAQGSAVAVCEAVTGEKRAACTANRAQNYKKIFK